MKIGRVLKELPLDRTMDGAQCCRFVRVECGSEVIAALDPVGTGVGEWVIVTCGEPAARLCPAVPIDAAIIAKYRNNG